MTTDAVSPRWQRTLISGVLTDTTLDNHSIIYNNLYKLSHETCEVACDYINPAASWTEQARHVIKRLVVIYLQQPFMLALLPLVIGIFFGFIIGRKGCNYKNRPVISHQTTATFVAWIITPIQNLLFSYFSPLNRQTAAAASEEKSRDEIVRKSVRKMTLTSLSGIPPSQTPHHIAVIMDGNRRYGKTKYNSATKGHWDGSRKLVEFSKWCLAEGVGILTVYAFSTENWLRDPKEVNTLMTIFITYCDEMRREAMENDIRICVMTTDGDRLPEDVRACYSKLVDDTKHCRRMVVNICMSYGGRGEIVSACRDLASDAVKGVVEPCDISEDLFTKRLVLPDSPDVVVRTSGEKRLSNFLLWQIAYAEMFFWDKKWPEVTREDLVELIRSYAKGRQRRFGK